MFGSENYKGKKKIDKENYFLIFVILSNISKKIKYN